MADLQHEYEHLTKPIVILPQARQWIAEQLSLWTAQVDAVEPNCASAQASRLGWLTAI
jgi:hypothetical protein